jgi:hypothetical protein
LYTVVWQNKRVALSGPRVIRNSSHLLNFKMEHRYQILT